ncbi:MAG TPA: SAP domain-containing protein [Phycisphaerales bacterium]|nr:SAP domain-containing protein [Phycisphaerales bacterium]
MPELKARANELGITPGKLNKTELIREIQIAEGFTPCYGTADGQCENTECCFVSDCNKV